MDLIVHVSRQIVLATLSSNQALSELAISQRNKFPMGVIFVDDGPSTTQPIIRVPIPAPYTRILVSARPNDDLDDENLLFFSEDFTASGSGDTLKYVGDLNTLTTPTAALFADSATRGRYACLLDIDLLVSADPDDGRLTLIKHRPFWLYRTLWQGDEGVPLDDVPSYPAPSAILTTDDVNDTVIGTDQLGAANGVATLDSGGTIPLIHIPEGPSKVDATFDMPQWPATGDLYALGDSQTWGTNSSGAPYTATGRLTEANRWPNMVATDFGRTLTVTNLGRPAQKISDAGGGTSETIWNAWGNVPADWSGVVAMMLGYNNSDADTLAPKFFARLQSAFEAFIARGLIEDFGGVGTSGWGSTGSTGGTLHSFSTTGTQISTAVTAGQSQNRNPFYYGNPDGAKLRIGLTSGQFVQFTSPASRGLGLFLYSSETGGDYTVTVNGVTRATGSTLYVPVGGNDPATSQYPVVVWLEDIPANAVIRLTSASGTVVWQAYGWSAASISRVVALAGPTGNQANNRTDYMLSTLNWCAQQAVSKFERWPVYHADPWTGWRREIMDELGNRGWSADISHLTVEGNRHVANAFSQAAKSGRARIISQQLSVLEVARLLDNVCDINMDPALWAATVANGATLSGGSAWNAQIGLRCSNTAGSSVVARNNSTGAMNSFVAAGLGSLSNFVNWDRPMRIFAALNVTNHTSTGVGYLQFGRDRSLTTIADLAHKGVGWRIANNQIIAQVHNGTDLAESGVLGTINTTDLWSLAIETAPGGQVGFWVNNNLAWSTTAGPQGLSNNLHTGIHAAATNGDNAAFYIINIDRIRVVHLPRFPRIP
jgi:hypothetical protein